MSLDREKDITITSTIPLSLRKSELGHIAGYFESVLGLYLTIKHVINGRLEIL